MKRALIPLVLLAALLGLFLLTQEEAAPETYPVVSADGTLILRIPREALPSGVAPDAIRILRVTDEEGGALYHLFPEGLTFLHPVPFSASLALPGDMVPFALHVSTTTGEIAGVENFRSELDRAHSVATVSGTLGHFSALYIGPLGIVADMHTAADQRVGGTREISVWMSASGEGESYIKKIDDAFNVRYSRVGDTIVSGNLESFGETLVPGLIPLVIPEMVLSPGETLRGTGTFTCAKDGAAIPRFAFRVRATIEAEWSGTSFVSAAGDVFLGKKVELSTVNSEYFVGNDGFDCLGGAALPPAPEEKAEVRTPPTPLMTPTSRPSGGTVKICGLPGGEPCAKR